MTCRCGRPASEHALILYSGGPEALPPSTVSAAVRGRKLTPAVRDAPDPAKPATARSAGPAPKRRLSTKQAAQVKAWRKVADRKGTT